MSVCVSVCLCVCVCVCVWSAGSIALRRSLDRELRRVYHLSVAASSHAPASAAARVTSLLPSNASVVVYVTDVNDNAPVFDFPSPSNQTVYIGNHVQPGIANHTRCDTRAAVLQGGRNVVGLQCAQTELLCRRRITSTLRCRPSQRTVGSCAVATDSAAKSSIQYVNPVGRRCLRRPVYESLVTRCKSAVESVHRTTD